MSAAKGIRRSPFSGSVLKLIAVITMLIDHVAYGLLYRMFYFGIYPSGWTAERAEQLYQLCRHIGRTAFPIFCFLLVEGFFHTRSRVKYLVRLSLFAVLSEVFFDLALTVWVNPEEFAPVKVLQQNPQTAASHQNVFFTLAIGLVVIWGIDTAKRLFGIQKSRGDNLRILRIVCTVAVLAVIVCAGCYLAHKVDTDYRYWGVILITLLYLFSYDRRLQAIVPYVVLCLIPFLFVEKLPLSLLHALPVRWQDFITPWTTEVYAFPAFALILFYNGKRGFLKSKPAQIAFYAFYPVHLAAIYLVRLLIL